MRKHVEKLTGMLRGLASSEPVDNSKTGSDAMKSDTRSTKDDSQSSNPSKTIWLHVGTDKTGSTALQDFLCINESLLKQHGIQYVNTARVRNHHSLYQDAIKGEGNLWKEVSEEVNKATASAFIISFEGLYHLNGFKLTKIHDLLYPHRVKVLIYIRRQSDKVRSGLAQRIKTENKYSGLLTKHSFKDIVKHATDYQPTLDRLSTTFGKENVVVRRYEPSRFSGGNLYRDFLEALEVPDYINTILDKEIEDEVDVNQSLDVESLHVLNMVSRLRIGEGKRKLLANYLMEIRDENRSTFINDEIAMEVDEHFMDSNRAIASNWFGENDLFSEPSAYRYRRPGLDLLSKYFRFVMVIVGLMELPIWKKGEQSLSSLLENGILTLGDGWVIDTEGQVRLASQSAAMAFRLPPLKQQVINLTLEFEDYSAGLRVLQGSRVLYSGEDNVIDFSLPAHSVNKMQRLIVLNISKTMQNPASTDRKDFLHNSFSLGPDGHKDNLYGETGLLLKNFSWCIPESD